MSSGLCAANGHVACDVAGVCEVGPSTAAAFQPLPRIVSPASSHGEVVHLDVGGYRFATNLSTMEACPSTSPLKELLCRPPGESGDYFIDRDGRHFHHVLNFLRGFVPPVELLASQELYLEACHYGLWDLALAVQSVCPMASLLSAEDAQLSDALRIMREEAREPCFDHLTRTVKSLLDVPIALVSLLGDDHCWFKSRSRLASQTAGNGHASSGNSSPSAFSFLPEHLDMLVIENTIADPRTRDSPLVIGEPRIGFYAGCPLVTSSGFRLGTLCAIDHAPRTLSPWQLQGLASLGRITVQEILLARLEEEQEQPATSGEGVSDAAAAAPAPEDGEHVRCRWPPPGGLEAALQDAVCLVQVNASCLDWPILYASQAWTHLTDIQIRPPDFPISLDKPGHERRDNKLLATRPRLRDCLSPQANIEEGSFARNCRNAWAVQVEPHSFHFKAMLTTVPPDASRGDGKEVARPANCYFEPVHRPLDVAAAAAGQPPVVGRPSKASVRSKPRSRESYLYFLRVVLDDNSDVETEPDRGPDCATFSTQDSAEERGTCVDVGEHEMFDLCRQDSSSGYSQCSAHSEAGGRRHNDAQARPKPPRQPFKDVQLSRQVRQGSFGPVYYGQWLGAPVAVKMIERKGREDGGDSVAEAGLSCTLVHPNLVQTFKYSSIRERAPRLDSGTPGSASMSDDEVNGSYAPVYYTWIVQEWCDVGTLRKLCDHPRIDPHSMIEVLQNCTEIASASSYLHSRGIVHGDLTADNVLCKTHVSATAKGYVCKLADFGLAGVLRHERNSGALPANLLGNVSHLPPELLRSGAELVCSKEADAYALGVLLWQGISGRSPWEGLAAQAVAAQVADGQRLSLPEGVPESVSRVFTRCTADEPASRPGMSELVGSLHVALGHMDADVNAA